jgi:hypothetical protein
MGEARFDGSSCSANLRYYLHTCGDIVQRVLPRNILSDRLSAKRTLPSMPDGSGVTESHHTCLTHSVYQ